jgi:thiaminase/transcriptional activator TenA
MITSAYTNFLLRTCYEGRMGEIVAALLPCAAGYVEIASQLRQTGLPEPPPYRDWIETYTSPGMREVTDWLAQRMDALAAATSPKARKRFLDLYRVSARYELLFFDMAWERSFWPACIPV